MPGRVTWAHVSGYRAATNNKFSPHSPIAFRKGFREEEPEVFKKAYELFSGKKQP
jgi:hypothetical protein